MANASAKKIAAQNETAIKNIQLGMLIASLLSILLRLLLRRNTLTLSFRTLLSSSTYLITFFLSRFLTRVGTPRRSASGELLSPGDDLNQAGMTEWCFDVLYITWACQVGSAALGDWVWWLYSVIPLYAGYKGYNLVSPFLLGRPAAAGADDVPPVGPTSKRQEKLRKRNERGDPRVKTQQRK
ncbi:DUF788-domain-containing protein [Gloeophyllum trabeum ATCC 11539]|uniref:DUF788-domain-containing protein n=1 Tax=Gloeophyllum trabeum (strain ATCC 11539 / FP-39264 / Madison 617) TaxID=670483 RepID=S7QJQ9_GLOTA|nr:DUF788-domain-containing protein [Gloeophyllum trabeum ATCC 11539]EPQ59572.1 DUF788-domain-containing protein [Gloeophyllum trabeum ATCC 11539]